MGNYSPQEDVDNDDGSAYYNTHDNFHHDNIYAYVGGGPHVCPTLPGHEDYFYNNKVVLTQSLTTGSPQCKEPRTVMHDNQYFTSSGKVSECDKPLPHGSETVSRLPSDSA